MKLNPLWLLWLLFAFAITFTPFRTIAETFRTHSPAPVASVLPAVPFLLAVGAWLTHRFRTPRWEPVALLALPTLLCLAKAPLPTLLAAALFLSAHSIGARFLTAPNAPLRIAFRFGAGLGAILLITLVAGFLKLLAWPLTVLLLLPALHNPAIAADLKTLRHSWSTAEDIRHPAVSVLIFFALLFAILGALWALTPAIAFDPLKMHLASARWYVETGAFTPVPAVLESYYPQGAELLMALLWLPGGQPAAQLLSPIFFLATLFAAAGILKHCGLRPIAILAGLVAASTLPFLHWTAFVAKNDFPLAFFLLASLASLLSKRPLLATVFLALAFGIKHVALFGAVGLTPLFLREIWQSGQRLRTFLAVSALFLSLGTFSLVRTYSLTGNPLYPESASRTTEVSVIDHPYKSTAERIMRYAGIPWLLHFDGQRAFESSSPNPMGFWLVFFALAFLLWIPDRNTALRLTLLFIAVYLLYWVSLLVTLRYAIVPIFLLTALTAPALFRLPRWLSAATVFYCLFFSLSVSTLIEVSPPQLLWWAGRIDTDTFLRQSLPTYPAIRTLDSKAGPGDRILSLGGCPSPYAPYSGAVRCVYLIDFSHSIDLLRDHIEQNHYRFLILPAEPVSSQILRPLPFAEMYRDSQFAVYLRNDPPNSR